MFMSVTIAYRLCYFYLMMYFGLFRCSFHIYLFRMVYMYMFGIHFCPVGIRLDKV